ncbi:MAG: response regulator transcription factor [Chloroflexi bacterium]|nr:response regulator transcription factor [Chloroflexota bacterium]
MTTIVLADDHHIVREGLRALLAREPDLVVVGEAADGLAALELVERNRPDILIVDVVMPGLNGLEVTRRAHEKFPETRVIVLTAHPAENYVVQALKNGAMGYVVKSVTYDVLAQAIHEVSQGRRYLSPPLSERALDVYVQAADHSDSDLVATLTCREQEVMQLALRGLTNAEIADCLCVSPTTIATHRANLFQKLGLHSQAELVKFALGHGILPLDE